MYKKNNIIIPKALRLALLLLLMMGVSGAWAGIPFEAKSRIINNGDGTYTTASNAGNGYALAIADLSEIAGITDANALVKVEFDCKISQGSRWIIGVGNKSIRGENAKNSSGNTYETDGIMHMFGCGSSGGAYYQSKQGSGNNYDNGTNNSTAYNDAFDKVVHATFTFDKSTLKYSYSLTNGETTYFSVTDRTTTVDNLTIIEVYSWQGNSTISLSDIKVNDGFYFPKGTDVMYIEDLEYNSPLVNETGQGVSYTVSDYNESGGRFRCGDGWTFPYYPIKTSGNNPANLTEGTAMTVTATTTGSPTYTTSMQLRIKTRNFITASSLVKGDNFNVGSSVGLINEESVNINGLTMVFGANNINNGKDEQQVIRSINGGYGTTCIDTNGWTFGNVEDFANSTKYWGTFYYLQTGGDLKDIVITGYFGGNGGLYDTSGNNIFPFNSSNGNLAVVRIPRDNLSENTSYVLYCPMNLLAIKSLAYTNIEVDFRYGTRDEAVAFMGETLAAPTFTVTTTEGIDITSHYTKGGFSSSNTSIATVNTTTGEVTTGSTKGKTVISCTLTSDDATKATYPDITVTFNLYVTDGVWDIKNQSTYTSMDNGLDDSQWSIRGGSHIRNKIYTNTDFEYIYNKSGDLYDVSYGLQTKGHTRFYSNGFYANSCNASFTMFSVGDNAALRIPARKGMLIEITATASDEETSLDIEGVKNIDGSPTNSYTTGKEESSSQYLCNTDVGYVTLYNNNAALSVDIKKITVTSQIVLRDGNKGEIIYVQKGTDYQNEIMNATDLGGSFTYTITAGNDLVTQDAEFTNNGKLTSVNGFGTITIEVSSSGVPTKTYTLQVVEMVLIHTSARIRVINGETDIDEHNYANDLKQYVKVYTTQAEKDAATTNADLRSKVEFSLRSCTSPTTTAIVSKSSEGEYAFSANGIGDAVLNVDLATIHREFTYHIRGVEFSVMNPVIPNTLESYSLTLTQLGSTINSTKAPEIVATYGNLNTPTIYKVENEVGGMLNVTLNISDITIQSDTYGASDIPSSKGGAFVVKIPVNYTDEAGENHNVEVKTVVTVAYSQHVWNFQGGDAGLSPDGISETMYDYESTPNSYNARPLPIDEHDYYVARNTSWEYQKKFRSPDSNGGYVYAYLKTVDGNNATVIEQSAGLQIYATGTMGVSSYATYTENGFTRNGATLTDGTYTDPQGKKYSSTDTKRELDFKNGCRIIIPQVKPGQQIDCYWHRHDPDHGERLRMNNLLDASGEEITDIYKIAFTGLGHDVPKASTGAGSYSFIVAGGGDTLVDVVIWSVDETWTRIHEIVLWDKPNNNYDETQSTYKSTMTSMDASRYLHVDYDESFTINMNDAAWQLNVHNGGSPTYTVEQDETLGATVDMSSGHPIFHYNSGGWGKFYVTLSNCTQDGKYISTWKSYTITVGKKPGQTYPYTWDFSKYKTNTKINIADNDREENTITIKVRNDKSKTVTRSTQTWGISNNDCTAQTTYYGGSNYESYFVDGAQLVSRALDAPLPETDGLGFSITNKSTGGLTLDMQSTVAATGSGASNGGTWKSGKLTITGGGTIIVPKPGDGFTNFYLYVRANVEPTVDVTIVEKQTTDVDESGTMKQFRYHFLQNADAILTFSGDANIYAIGVTNIFKGLTPLSGTAWATESRDVAIDHSLTGYLTKNPVKAYAIIETEDNPIYSVDKRKTSVAINDQRYVVPENIGLVLKQTGVPMDATAYSVPLFYPAVTTKTDDSHDFDDNLMQPSVSPTIFNSETETFNGKEYTRFILGQRYMTWKREDGIVTNPTQFETRNVAAFYRMHIYGSAENLKESDGTFLTAHEEDANAIKLNTLGANKAYLLLETAKIEPAIWNTNSPSPRRYIAIEGVSDMEELELLEEAEREANRGDGRIYNLNGQVVGGDEKTLPAGIYIRNGKKLMIR